MSETRTKRPAFTASGVTFESWKVGIGHYVLRSEDKRLAVWGNGHRNTYSASVDGEVIGRRFLSESGAISAAIRQMRARL